jgi:hypothetical protein
MEWIDNSQDATTEDFITNKQNFDKTVFEVKEKLEAPGISILPSLYSLH